MQQLLTPKQVAKQLNTKETNVLRWLRLGILPGLKVGREWRIVPEDLEAFVERNRQRPKLEQ